jgi:hypothetical protein
VDIAPGLAGLCPLIETNGEAIIGWLPDGRFVQFYYEDGKKGDAAIEVLGRNYQEFVLSLLLKLEDAGLRDEWIEFAAAPFGFMIERSVSKKLPVDPSANE